MTYKNKHTHSMIGGGRCCKCYGGRGGYHTSCYDNPANCCKNKKKNTNKNKTKKHKLTKKRLNSIRKQRAKTIRGGSVGQTIRKRLGRLRFWKNKSKTEATSNSTEATRTNKEPQSGNNKQVNHKPVNIKPANHAHVNNKPANHKPVNKECTYDDLQRLLEKHNFNNHRQYLNHINKILSCLYNVIIYEQNLQGDYQLYIDQCIYIFKYVITNYYNKNKNKINKEKFNNYIKHFVIFSISIFFNNTLNQKVNSYAKLLKDLKMVLITDKDFNETLYKKRKDLTHYCVKFNNIAPDYYTNSLATLLAVIINCLNNDVQECIEVFKLTNILKDLFIYLNNDDYKQNDFNINLIELINNFYKCIDELGFNIKHTNNCFEVFIKDVNNKLAQTCDNVFNYRGINFYGFNINGIESTPVFK